MSQNGLVAHGFKFRLGNFRLRIWKNGMEYETKRGGRWFFFPWHPSRWRK